VAVSEKIEGEVIAVKEGRRKYDWRALFTYSGQVSLFFWAFGWLLDEKRKPSFARIFLTCWSWLGWRMIVHELGLPHTGLSLQNPVWVAWWAAEGVAWIAVFGPRVASYFGKDSAGGMAVTAISQAVRDSRLPSKHDDMTHDAG
jgi:hypothetical protein